MPGLILGGALIVFLIFVRVVAGRFSSLTKSLDYLNRQIAQAEVLIDYTANLDPKKLDRELEELNARLESPLQISAVLEELGRVGEPLGVSFKSVEPSGAEVESSVAMKLALEGPYQGVGEFLGSLDKLDTALVRVKTLSVAPQAETASLLTQLEVELYRPSVEVE